MDFQASNNAVYNKHAERFKKLFQNDGPRTYNIKEAFHLAGDPAQAHVVEIGCGTGRDAAEIVNRAEWYEGFDPASKMIEVARAHVPTGRFVVSDAVNYEYPSGLDIVFAFASLLHVDSDAMKLIFTKVAHALRPGGVFYIRLREKDEYSLESQTDEYGERMYYHYNTALLERYAGRNFELVHTDRDFDSKRKIKWLGVGFRRL